MNSSFILKEKLGGAKKVFIIQIIAIAFACLPAMTQAQDATKAPVEPEQKMIEIYRIAPGKHEAFLKFIAYLDEINKKAGLPPRDLYVHSDGGDWDFIIIQPAHTPPEKVAALDKAWDEMNAPSGAEFFIEIRKFIAKHTDTFAKGPMTAKDFLAGIRDKD